MIYLYKVYDHFDPPPPSRIIAFSFSQICIGIQKNIFQIQYTFTKWQYWLYHRVWTYELNREEIFLISYTFLLCGHISPVLGPEPQFQRPWFSQFRPGAIEWLRWPKKLKYKEKTDNLIYKHLNDTEKVFQYSLIFMQALLFPRVINLFYINYVRYLSLKSTHIQFNMVLHDWKKNMWQLHLKLSALGSVWANNFNHIINKYSF